MSKYMNSPRGLVESRMRSCGRPRRALTDAGALQERDAEGVVQMSPNRSRRRLRALYSRMGSGYSLDVVR